jgi:four helix bundle protein
MSHVIHPEAAMSGVRPQNCIQPHQKPAARDYEVKDFHELKVWQKAHQLALAVYRLTAGFPREELYGLTTRLRRASSSIPANLAEGSGRNGDAELARFCSIAAGSASELEYHLLLAKDLALIKPADYEELAHCTTELKRMLAGLLQKLSTDR